MKKIYFALVCTVLLGCGDATEGGVEESSSTGAASAPPDPGELVYNRFCFSCHGAGIAGAPRVGDKAAWAPRLAKGRDAMLESTIQGVPPGMPPMGLCQSCTDEELSAAIDYMTRGVADSGAAPGD